MNRQQYWRRQFARYVQGWAGAQEQEVLNRFFEQQAADSAGVWSELGEEPAHVQARIRTALDQRLAAEKPAKRWQPLLKLAAAVALLAGATVWFSQRRPAASGELAQQVISAAKGQRKRIVLPDGTRILLNSDSRLRWQPTAYKGRQRVVYLEGEAFFDVYHDERRPFRVVTPRLTTRVLGTSFNVNTHDRHYAVAVATGAVRVTARRSHKPLLLRAREQARLDVTTNQLQPAQQSATDAYAWVNHVLVFDNSPVSQVAARLERWYNVPIHYDAALGGQHIRARYERESLPHVLQSLAFSLGCTCAQAPDGSWRLRSTSSRTL
ncbi:FecR family protein [Hymenobacter crusticola]|uniref:FecR protein domain-containing protein n=1 Tax=Hymenobacter crusticola TaxID=1770526 RepID=A0A243WGG0_9BACT|nr:FecR domain-containing protein [Hymenobacter crusticola]OUJ74841.1 hypothetical protein BXP70_08805 [Hymenobacter crusticola]